MIRLHTYSWRTYAVCWSLQKRLLSPGRPFQTKQDRSWARSDRAPFRSNSDLQGAGRKPTDWICQQHNLTSGLLRVYGRQEPKYTKTMNYPCATSQPPHLASSNLLMEAGHSSTGMGWAGVSTSPPKAQCRHDQQPTVYIYDLPTKLCEPGSVWQVNLRRPLSALSSFATWVMELRH
jgi:hypothetical protein